MLFRTVVCAVLAGLVLVGAAQAQVDSTAIRDSTASPDTTRLSPASLDTLETSTLQPVKDILTLPFRPFGGQQVLNRTYRQDFSVYESAPALRYNRVEGLVIGGQAPPMTWTQPSAVHPYGQAAYATGLRDLRATGGLEVRLVRPTPISQYGLKVGVQVARTTTTEDHWKRSWASNSVSAFLYGDDLFTYYEVHSVTAYAVQRLSSQVQLSVGAAFEEHDPLRLTTDFSLLEDNFEPNLPVESAKVRSGIVSTEIGRLEKRSKFRVVGSIARVYLEAGDRVGVTDTTAAPDYYHRVILDAQTYRPVLPNLNVNLRARYGSTSESAPVQLKYQLDGVRGLRTFTPPTEARSQMLLGGFDVVHYDVPTLTGLLDPVHANAFLDAGWIGDDAMGDRFRNGDTFSFAGIGIAALRRLVSVELAWPLHTSTGGSPQFTLRINPLR